MNIRKSVKKRKVIASLLLSCLVINFSSARVLATEDFILSGVEDEVIFSDEVNESKSEQGEDLIEPKEEVGENNNEANQGEESESEDSKDDANNTITSESEETPEIKEDIEEDTTTEENSEGQLEDNITLDENVKYEEKDLVLTEELYYTGWQIVEGQWHYFNEYGIMQFGWQFVDGRWYYLSDTGAMQTGWQIINGQWYYLNEYGTMELGWQFIGGKWYYLNEYGAMETGWQFIDGRWYYLDIYGQMQSGWLALDGVWYYLNTTGEMLTGWQIIDGAWYYLDESGKMKTGWQAIDGKWYYLNEYGRMTTGWQSIDGKVYYLDSYGVMKTGWLNENNQWYYLDIYGARVSSEIKVIDNNKYYFHADGVMASDFWFGTSYAKSNGIVIEYADSMSHSSTQYNLFKYMLDEANQESVHKRAIQLHNGITSNNCVYFSSEALRRVGVNIPTKTSYTTNFEKELTKLGWNKSTNLNDLRPGDVVFAGTAHAYIFMGWAEDGYAYVVDNQKDKFGTVFHKRNVKKYSEEFDTDPSTHFYYLPR